MLGLSQKEVIVEASLFHQVVVCPLFHNLPLIHDEDSGEIVADLARDGDVALLARGGDGGFGNIHFKSSINRAPRRSTPGRDGEERRLRLELRVLADVGLLGMPNAGKSTLIAAISNARPKIADYPFTTLHPNLGVVRVGPEKSFVVADIPGLIEGASEGAGLGHQFLRHLQRTGLLLHLVDLSPIDPQSDPANDARAILRELRAYDSALYEKPRWLVLNKIDMIPEDERQARIDAFTKRLRGRGRSAIPVDTTRIYPISALTREGCQQLIWAIQEYLDSQRTVVESEPDVRFTSDPLAGPPVAASDSRRR